MTARLSAVEKWRGRLCSVAYGRRSLGLDCLRTHACPASPIEKRGPARARHQSRMSSSHSAGPSWVEARTPVRPFPRCGRRPPRPPKRPATMPCAPGGGRLSYIGMVAETGDGQSGSLTIRHPPLAGLAVISWRPGEPAPAIRHFAVRPEGRWESSPRP